MRRREDKVWGKENRREKKGVRERVKEERGVQRTEQSIRKGEWEGR